MKEFVNYTDYIATNQVPRSIDTAVDYLFCENTYQDVYSKLVEIIINDINNSSSITEGTQNNRIKYWKLVFKIMREMDL